MKDVGTWKPKTYANGQEVNIGSKIKQTTPYISTAFCLAL